MSTTTALKPRKDFWLETLTDEIHSVKIVVGMIPYVSANGEYVRSEDDERVSSGRFYHELSKVMTTEWKWEEFFAGKEVSFTHTHEEVHYVVTFQQKERRQWTAQITRVLDDEPV